MATTTTFYLRLETAADATQTHPSGFLGAWDFTDGTDAGANIKYANPTTAGSSQQNITKGNWASQNGGNKFYGMAQFATDKLTAQTVGSGNWTVGVANSGTLGPYNYDCYVGIYLVNGSTGAIRTTVAASVLVGSSGKGGGTSELTTKGNVSCSSFTSTAGDYLVFEFGEKLNGTGGSFSPSTALYTSGTTTISGDNVPTSDAKSFVTAPVSISYAVPQNWYMRMDALSPTFYGNPTPGYYGGWDYFNGNNAGQYANWLSLIPGTHQVALTPSFTSTATGTAKKFAFAQFISDPLQATSIPAANWTASFAGDMPSAGVNYTWDAWIHIGVINDAGNLETVIYEGSVGALTRTSTTETSCWAATISGSAATVNLTDHLICEIAIRVNNTSGNTLSTVLDSYTTGGTSITSDTAGVSDARATLIVPTTLAPILPVGTANGDATAIAISLAIKLAKGTSSPDSTAQAVGVTITAQAGTANADSTASGKSAALKLSVGTALATSNAIGTGITLTLGLGTASATSSAAGTGAALSIGAGTALATSSAIGMAAALSVGKGTASGTSSASAMLATWGTASADSTAIGKSAALKLSVGTAIATSNAIAVGLALIARKGTALADSTAIAVGIVHQLGTGTALADSTAIGKSAAIKQSVGNASADSQATGISLVFDLVGGTANGSSTAGAVGGFFMPGFGAGTALADSTAIAISVAIKQSLGTATADSSATALATVIKQSAGTANGTSTAHAVSPILISMTGGAAVGGTSPNYFSGESSGADSLRLYFSGAASDGATQSSQASSLGNFRSSTEATRIGIRQLSVVDGLELLQASHWNGQGTGGIFASSSTTASYTAPGGVQGAATDLSANPFGLLADGSDPSKWVRVKRSGSLLGGASVEFDPQYNNVFGFSDSANAETVAGSSKYRAVFVKNQSVGTITNFQLWLRTLATQTLTVSGLPLTGSGTVTGTTFCGWPAKGWCRSSSGEIFYYSGIDPTLTILTVPSAGRGLLGTTATAGSVNQTLDSVPGIRAGTEWASPKVAGSVQTLANESATPGGVSWTTALTAGTGLSLPTINTNEQFVIWIHRQIPAGMGASAKIENEIAYSFVANAITYHETLDGLFRAAVTSRQRYELYLQSSATIDYTQAPNETFTSLPFTTVNGYGNGTYQYSLGKRNQYDLVSYTTPQQLIVSGGNLINNPPSSPDFISISPNADGSFQIVATYFFLVDSPNAGDKFAVYVSSAGTPLSNSPTLVAFNKNTFVGKLNYKTSIFSIPTTLTVCVRSYRTSDTTTSINTDLHSATSAAGNFVNSTLKGFYAGIAEET